MHLRVAALFLLLSLPLRADSTSDRLDHYLTARTNLGQFSGTALVAHEGKVLLRKGYGYANLEHLVRNSPETRFEIASLTKAFTAFAVHELARQGKVRLDAPMCAYVEACPEAWKGVTVAQLVHHTSGIPDYEEAQEMGSEAYYTSLMRDDSAKASVEWARAKPLDFVPGSKSKYSNTGYLILGFILERVSGKRYEELLREVIFTPLQMTSTMHIDRTRPQLHRADGYTHQAPLYDVVAGFPLTSPHLRRVPPLRQEAPQADGGLLSTVDDLHAWGRALLGHGPFAAEALAGLFRPNEPGSYGFGWVIGRKFDRTLYSHTGILPGMVSTFHLYPESNTIVIVLGNLDRARMSNIARDLTHIILGRPYDVPRSHKATTIDAGRAARFTGTYKLADGRLLRIGHDAKNGWLEAEVKEQFTAGLLPESDLVYYAPMWEGTITFVPDADGSVPALLMRQTGVDLQGERVKE
ncbi:MAG TPA: serine hydrolase domain-containing protein [Thermoanaerobaculia bacterium]|nr:serine hydrolase domain-containing protein [Thermoanaerobaculia bacterium]